MKLFSRLTTVVLLVAAHNSWATSYALTSYALASDEQNDVGAMPSHDVDASLYPTIKHDWYMDPFSHNYALAYDKDARSTQYTVFNASVAHHTGVTTATFAASTDTRLNTLTRLESAWSWNVPDSAARVRLGDGISSSGTWGNAVRFGGIQIGTASTTRADIITSPLLGTAGLAVLPSTADLLSANLRNAATRGGIFTGVLPQAAKPGNVNIPVSDALGRSYMLSQPLFQSISLMPRGHSDFSFEAGRVREDFARRSDQYGAWLLSGSYRYGLGNRTTVDAHAAALDATVSVAGLGIAEQFGSWGAVSATMATSHTPDSAGWLARMGYEVSINRVNLAIRSHVQSLGFQDLRSPLGIEPLKDRTLASAGFSLDHFGNMSIAGVSQTFGAGEREEVVALSHSVPMGQGGLFSTAATYAPGPVRGSSVLLSFSYPFVYGNHRQAAANNTRSVINNVTDRNLLTVLDSARPVKP